jgi:hypothetical protein
VGVSRQLLDEPRRFISGKPDPDGTEAGVNERDVRSIRLNRHRNGGLWLFSKLSGCLDVAWQRRLHLTSRVGEHPSQLMHASSVDFEDRVSQSHLRPTRIADQGDRDVHSRPLRLFFRSMWQPDSESLPSIRSDQANPHWARLCRANG